MRGDEGGYLYVLLFTNGLVKVGRSITEKRLYAHRAEGQRHGNPVTTEWLSVEIPRGLEFAEEALVAACRLPGVTWLGREWFTGLAFEDAIRAAEHVVNKWVVDIRFEGVKMVFGHLRTPPVVQVPNHLPRAPVAACVPPLPSARASLLPSRLPRKPPLTSAELAELAMLDQALEENGWPPRRCGEF